MLFRSTYLQISFATRIWHDSSFFIWAVAACRRMMMRLELSDRPCQWLCGVWSSKLRPPPKWNFGWFCPCHVVFLVVGGATANGAETGTLGETGRRGQNSCAKQGMMGTLPGGLRQCCCGTVGRAAGPCSETQSLHAISQNQYSDQRCMRQQSPSQATRITHTHTHTHRASKLVKALR